MGENELEALRRENTTLRKALAESKREKAYLDSILKATPLFLRCDLDMKVEFISRLRHGYRMEDVLGTSMLAFIPPDFRDIAQAAFEQALSGESAHFPSANLVDGKMELYESDMEPVFEDGEVVGVSIVSVDVTADREKGEALRIMDDKLRMTVDATGIGLWTWDPTNGVVWNARMREITGHDTPLNQEEWGQLVHPEDRELVAKNVRLVKTGVFGGAPHRIVRPDGEVRWVLPVGVVRPDASGEMNATHGGILDITKQRKLEEQIAQVQKLDAVGSLTAGVAHNFNNLLMAIIPTLEIVQPVVPSTHTKYIEDAMHAAERGAELVRELMTFAGQRGRVSKEQAATAEVIDHAVKICRRTFGALVDLDVHYADDLPPLFCDAGGIEHVLVNLLLNARDALPSGGGRIDVSVRCAAPEEIDKVRGDSGVCIEVRDNGRGIDPAIRPKIFEPFVSSKGPKGTGLGLSTAFAIVADHGGSIEVESTLDVGTTFRVFLPADDVRPGPRTAPVVPNARHVLIVDDESAVRHVVRRMLEHSDFVVTAAASVAEAAEALVDTTPDLVLLDRSLPEVAGRELVPVVRQRCPSAKILYFTGQHIPPEERAEVDGVLQKPMRREGLVTAIEKALQGVALEDIAAEH